MAEDTRDLSFLPGDYELDTFTVSRINEGSLMVEQGVTSKTISLTSVFKGAAQ